MNASITLYLPVIFLNLLSTTVVPRSYGQVQRRPTHHNFKALVHYSSGVNLAGKRRGAEVIPTYIGAGGLRSR